MSGLLPSEPDTSAASEADPRVVGLDDDEAGEVLAALSSETARRLLAALHDDPDSASGVADRADTYVSSRPGYCVKNNKWAWRIVDRAVTVAGNGGDE